MGQISRLMIIIKSKFSSVLDKAEDPRDLVEYAYTQQQELLRNTKRGLIEVATARTRLEHQARKLRTDVPRLDEQARKSLTIGREDLARIALERKQTVLSELSALEVQISDVSGQQAQLTQTEQQLSSKVEQFRITKGSIVARYTAAQAQVRVTEAVTGVSKEFADLGMALGRAVEKTENMQARADAIGGLMDVGGLDFGDQGVDSLDRRLSEASAEMNVERELAALKAGQAPSDQSPAIEEPKQ